MRTGHWTLDSEASRRPGARTLPPARLQSAVVKTAVVAQAPNATASPDRPHRVRQVYSRAASKYLGSVARLRSLAVSECIGIAELPAWQTLVTRHWTALALAGAYTAEFHSGCSQRCPTACGRVLA